MNNLVKTIVVIMTGFIVSCANQSVEYKACEHYPRKNPNHVHFYSKTKEPIAPYKIIGIAKINKYNLLGKKRNPQQLNEMMQKLAADLGGDGVLDLEEQEHAISARIIAYQKILL